VGDNAVVSGGTILGGVFGGDCKIRGGDWNQAALSVMKSMPEYKKHFRYGALISGEWDDVPEDVKKKIEPFGPTGKHPDAKIENPENIGPDVLIGKDAVISGRAEVRGDAQVTGGEISGDAVVTEDAKVSGGEISGNAWVNGHAQVTGGKISGGSVSGNAWVSGDARVRDNAIVTGGTISGGRFGGDCKIGGGDWSQATFRFMSEMPEYAEHFKRDGALISGEWDDVPDDVKKKLEEENAR
jgi:hypothetical protein